MVNKFIYKVEKFSPSGHAGLEITNYILQKNYKNSFSLSFLQTVIADLEARFIGLTESTDAFTVIADIIDGDFDDVEDNLTILANFYGFDEQKLIFEWSDFEDIIAKKDLDDVN